MVSTNSLFSLLRYALGTARPEDGVVLEKLTLEEWNEVFDLAGKQNVIAIAHDGLDAAAANGVAVGRDVKEADEENGCEVWSDFVSDWGANVYSLEQKYKGYIKTAEKLALFYAGHGLQMMVLKGWGLSLDWPVPKHRPTGDIDVFLLEEGAKVQSFGSNDSNASLGSKDLGASIRGDKAIEDSGIKVNKAFDKHSSFLFEGISVENHHTLFAHHTHRSHKAEDEWLKTLLLDKGTSKHTLGEATICLPNKDFALLFQLRHTASDFVSGGISLRQVLDWGLLLRGAHRNGNDIHWDDLMPFIREENMLGIFHCLNAICVDGLDIEAECFPEIDRSVATTALTVRIINDIINPEFNEVIPDRKRHLLRYGWVKGRRVFANAWKYRLAYKESLWTSFWTLSVNRLKNG